MKSKVYPMKEIAKRQRQFIVPDYHYRDYAWGERQWEDVWIPIDEFGKGDMFCSYFFGIVLTEQPELDLPSDTTIDKIRLLDGQQRMMTAFILFALLRNLEGANGRSKVSKEIHNTFLVNRHTSNNDAMKIVPREKDREAFARLIMGGERVDSRIFDAYDYFKEHIKYARIPLEKVMDALLRFTMVNIITAEEFEDADQIWRTLPPQCQDFFA